MPVRQRWTTTYQSGVDETSFATGWLKMRPPNAIASECMDSAIKGVV